LLRTLASDPYVPVRSVVYGLPTQLDLDAKPDTNHDTRFELRGVKFWMDGSPYTGGAAFAEPYEDTELTRDQLHLPPGHLGPLNYELGEFTEVFGRFHRAGYHVAVHTQGERSVQLVLDAAETVLKANPWDDHRHRLEHNALITTEQIQRALSSASSPITFISTATVCPSWWESGSNATCPWAPRSARVTAQRFTATTR
jgi:predicted amidohydrolase YtcJ